MKQYVIALDQGTTSSRAIIFDKDQNIAATAQKEFTQYYPKPGWVEHDPMEIYSSLYSVLMEAVAKSNIAPAQIAAVGITNQRETVVVWDRTTGLPVCNAIVWQCRRTAELCEEMRNDPIAEYIRANCGLPIDAYFSATKLRWILENIPGARERAGAGELLFGTVDSWVVWKLTGGKAHVTDYTNASRTMLYNIRDLCWDETLLKYFGIPRSMLPEVRDSSDVYGYIRVENHEIPIAGIAGDQQAALFGQACFEKGEAKNTYGTGCFLLMNTGETMGLSRNGMITTIAMGRGGAVQYALEGSVFVGGAVVQWLRDEMRFFSDAGDSAYFAQRVKDNGGVYLVPAFTGLGAPHWDMYARGAIFGLTRGCGRNHIIRAALESIAYQTNDVLQAIQADSGVALAELKVDGGASANDFLMQFQSDIIGTTVRRPMIRETTALGAAYLAGLAVGVWKDIGDIKDNWTLDRLFTPTMEPQKRTGYLAGWNKAVERAKHWEG